MQVRVNRRGFLRASAATVGAVFVSQLAGCNGGSFAHGVASGDPSSDSVVIWTRVTPSTLGEVPVYWEVASDQAFRRPVAVGVVTTDETVDYTVKVDVCGLRAGRTYYYRFRTVDAESTLGRTKTLPEGHVTSFRMAVVSCANYPQGHFYVCRELATREVDLVVMLGDYIYETGNSRTTSIRSVLPDAEVLTLADYRARYAHHHTDADLQALHARHPFALVWDDHEVANNSWQDGALGHGSTEGVYAERRAAAFQAYYEWLPVREPASGERGELWRTLEVGDLLALHMLDTRHAGRERALEIVNYVNPSTGVVDGASLFADLEEPRALLGEAQKTWLTGALANEATWQVLGQQILTTPIWLPAAVALRLVTFAQYRALKALEASNPSALTAAQRRVLAQPDIPYNLDAWDGYPNEQRWLFNTAQQLDLNLIVLAGDTHNAWASDLESTDGTAIGAELACPSISSRGLEELLAGQDPDLVAASALAFVEKLRFAETEHRGWLEVTVTHEHVTGEWFFVDSVKESSYALLPEKQRRLRVLPGTAHRRVVEAV